MVEQKAMDWLNGNQLSYDIWNNKYRFNGESFNEWLERVSGGDKEVSRLIEEKKFLFGGRTLSNRGTGNNSSFSNCYSSGYAPDSVEGMLELSKRIALTYKSEGGQGISMSKVRPKGSPVGKHGFTSDGIIPFMEVFNQVTSSISQGGSRKGALMLSLDVWHKEIEEFINVKSDSNKINKANLSVEVDDRFMNSIKKYYNGEGYTTIHNEFVCENGEVINYTVDPIAIYKKMMYMAWDNAEPGIIYIERFRNYNLMQYIDEYEIITGNPCGEQPLPKDGACNLGSINLSVFIDKPFTSDAKFNYEEFKKSVRIAIRGLDSVITDGMNLHALQEQRDVAMNYRNTGLGIMGLGDMFFKLGIKYGSIESKSITGEIMDIMFREAIFSSNELAKEYGSFPKYRSEVLDSDIIKYHFDENEIEILKVNGLRNCSLLSVAPSGLNILAHYKTC
jgi:ribonucleoside-diphosphate reductase alpha chain